MNVALSSLESNDDSEYELLPSENSESTSNIFHVRCEKCQKGNAKSSRRKLIIVSAICLIFMIAEIVGGVISNSLALATDASHLLVDFGSFMINLLSLWLASRPATEEMNFGWYRAETLGALISVLMIWFVTGILMYEAALRVSSGSFEIKPVVMLSVAIVGIFANIVMGVALHWGDGIIFPQRNFVMINLNIRTAFIHVVGDFIQSISVFVSALIIYFKPKFKVADPICTLIFSLTVIATTMTVIKDILLILMEGVPKGIHFNDIQNLLLEIPGVIKIHNLRLWALSSDKVELSAHIIIQKGENPVEILKKASESIISSIHVYELTLQIEEYVDDESLNCGLSITHET